MSPATVRRVVQSLVHAVILAMLGSVLVAPSAARADGPVEDIASLDPCSTAVKSTWYLAMEMTNVIPGLGILLRIGANVGKTANYAHCRNNGEDFVTLERMIAEAERIAGEAVDEAKVELIESTMVGIRSTIDSYRPLLEQVDRLNAAERAQLAGVMEALGNDAAVAEAGAMRLGWPGQGPMIVLGGIRNAAWVLAWELLDPEIYRSYRQGLLNRIAHARDNSVAAISASESEFRATARQMEIVRRFTIDLPSDAPPGKIYNYRAEVKAEVRSAPDRVDFAYSDWTPCPWGPDVPDWYGCNDRQWFFDELDSQHWFDEAWRIGRAARKRLAESAPPEYVAAASATGVHGSAFRLVNSAATSDRRCLDVRGGPDAGPGGRVGWRTCEQDLGAQETISLQLWGFVGGTAQLRHVRSGLCLDAHAEGPGSVDRVARLARCGEYDTPSDPVASDQQWGIHPLGYLVNTAGGLCLSPADSPSDGIESVGSGVLVECEYDLASRPGGPDASVGITSHDPASLQLWEVAPAAADSLLMRIEGHGSVAVTGGGTCAADVDTGRAACTQVPPDGASATMTATPTGSQATGKAVFVGWSGDCAGSDATCTVRMDRARYAVAHFAPPVRTFIQGSGSVTSEPAGLSCSSASTEWPPVNSPVCEAGFRLGTEVTLHAVPADGSVFDGWYGACAGSGPTCTLTVAHGVDQTSTARFVPPQPVVVTRSGDGTGTVTSGGPIDCGLVCSATFPIGTPVTFRATPAAGSTFGGWTGLCAGAAGTSCTVSLTRTRLTQGIGARFDPTTPSIRNITAPAVQGTAQVGETLTVDPGDWDPAGASLSFRWLRDDSTIPGATGTSYVLGDLDLHRHISVIVTASKPGYADAAMTSVEIGPVLPADVDEPLPEDPLVARGTPTITGPVEIGGLLVGSAPDFEPTADEVGYRWLADGLPIPGADDATLRLGSTALVGRSITLQVTGHRRGFVDGWAMSDATGPVARAKVEVKASVNRTRVRLRRTRLVVRVALLRAEDLAVIGRIRVGGRGTRPRSAVVVDGTARVRMAPFHSAGGVTLTVRYGGSALVEPAIARIRIRVVR